MSTYGANTWVLTKAITDKLKINQLAIESKILKVTMKHHKTNTRLTDRTGFQDVMEKRVMLKWQWPGHVARKSDRENEKSVRFVRQTKLNEIQE